MAGRAKKSRRVVWDEIPEEEVVQAIADRSLHPWKLWEAIQQGEQDEAIRMLMHAGWDFPIDAVKVSVVPDALRGDRVRVWVSQP
jgi:hypothetical protein